MKNLHSLLVSVVISGYPLTAAAQTGPFNPEAWPPTVNPSAIVNYVVTDSGLGLPSPDSNWFPDTLEILTGSDHGTEDVMIGGHTGKKVIGNNLNVADHFYTEWADDEIIDILVQVYGNEALLTPEGQPRDYVFLTGVLPDLNFPVGGQIPEIANNKKWNWVLFRIPNDLRLSGDSRYVGSVPPGAQGNTVWGGVNGGTIRFEAVQGLIVRVVAFGEQGAFGEPDQINHFLAADACDPEPISNLVSIDINAQTADHLVVLDDRDQTVFYRDDVGPAGDIRRAVGANGLYLNFGITDEYLGKACNDPRTVKVCVEFYDDPVFAGASPSVAFGPEAYATDALGGVSTVPVAQRHVMQGSGEWIRRSWTIPAVNLMGVNADPYTAGPRFISENDAVLVSSFQLAVLRTGNHPLAGIDPLEDCYVDPNICTDVYGNYAELDLHADVRDGLDVGSSGGDQEMIVEEAGPTGDRRLAVRPAFDDGSTSFTHQFLNFAILDEALGPNTQPPAHLAICVTYYDDPALTGATFRPEVFFTETAGVLTHGFTDDSYLVTLAGTDEWRTAYWEIEDIKFNGVNQPPQAAARFTFSDKVFFTAVKYAVIRPCGVMAGVNLLEACKPPEDIPLQIGWQNDMLQIAWPVDSGEMILQETPTLAPSNWSPVIGTPEEIDGNYVLQVQPVNNARYYRLTQ